MLDTATDLGRTLEVPDCQLYFELRGSGGLVVLVGAPMDARAFAPLAPRLLAMSKCPDFVVDRGHYFGTNAFTEEPGLSDEDKRALIEFLKTF